VNFGEQRIGHPPNSEKLRDGTTTELLASTATWGLTVTKLAQLLILFMALSTSQSGAKLSPPTDIAVRLSLQKKTYTVGENIQVRVQIENLSDQPIVVSNLISNSDNREGYVEFTLSDKAGRREFPQTRLIADALAPFPQQPDWHLILGRWIVLYPNCSMTSHLSVDGATFPFLSKPGRYRLSGAYSSAGLAYPTNYRSLGLNEEDVRSLKFSAWSGKVHSNAVWITIAPHAPVNKQR